MFESKEVIVSLTSWPKRIGMLGTTLDALLAQTAKPDRIIVWLAKDEFGRFANSKIPKDIRAYRSKGVEFRWTPKSYTVHNKYQWTMREFPDAICITVDDDIVYLPTLVEDLLTSHGKHPGCVVAARTHIIKVGEDGQIAPYADWTLEQHELEYVPLFCLHATGVGGVLYPPHIFDEVLFDLERIERLCLRADDLWLKVNEVRMGVPVVQAIAGAGLVYTPGTQEVGLYHTFLEAGGNDHDLALLLEEFPEVREKITEAAREVK